MRVALLGAGDVDRLRSIAPGSADDATARYVAALVRDGAGSYVANAPVEMKALVVEGRVLPVAVNADGKGAAGICSPSAHYVAYRREDVVKGQGALFARLLDPLVLPLRAILRIGAIDRVVYVNEWLLPTNPAPGLSAAEMSAVTDHLAEAYPGSAIVFRSINPQVDRPGFDALLECGYRMLASRRVYLLDARRDRHLEHQNARDDLALLRRTPYAIIGSSDAIFPHVARLAALYHDLYVVKHSHLNPQYDARFFALTLQERVLEYRAFLRDGRIDAFVAWFVRDGVLTGVVVGYDQGLPRTLGLYRQAFALVMKEAADRRFLLNISSGVGRFKRLRGAVPAVESDAIYDRHLPPRQRVAWSSLRLAVAGGAAVRRLVRRVVAPRRRG